jgi:hypothetical protein
MAEHFGALAMPVAEFLAMEHGTDFWSCTSTSRRSLVSMTGASIGEVMFCRDCKQRVLVGVASSVASWLIRGDRGDHLCEMKGMNVWFEAQNHCSSPLDC